MSFNANVHPKDINGNSIEPGFYRVANQGTARVGQVFEAVDSGSLYILFDGEDRPQRLDELSQFCVWAPAEQSELKA